MSALEELHRSSGDYRIVWEILFGYTQYDRDDEYENAIKSRQQRVVHVIAPTLALAKTLFEHKWPARCDYEFVSATPLCTINDEMDLTRGWRA